MEELNIDSDQDGDTCNTEELNNAFNNPYHLAIEEAVSLKDNYLLHMSAHDTTGLSIGVGLSDKSCAIYDLTETSLIKTATLDAHSSTITNVKFGNEKKLFYTSSTDGSVKVWDLRTSSKSSIIDFKVDNEARIKPILCFDIAKNDKLLCAGTELIDGDAFLLFWDIRNSKSLGGYWETHNDDITQVAFQKNNPDSLASGSTDGLINVYNLLESQEDDALLYTLNTNSSVEKIGWFSFNGKEDAIHCITHTCDLLLWKIEDDGINTTFKRAEISKSLKRISAADCYVASIHETENGELIIVSGSNAKDGECLRLLKTAGNNLNPMSQLLENKQIVRTSYYSTRARVLVTGGENGILSVWKPGKGEMATRSTLKDMTKINKLHKKRPY